jgi:anti-sigma regulatory factor (Ser/Thr protein kinase)
LGIPTTVEQVDHDRHVRLLAMRFRAAPDSARVARDAMNALRPHLTDEGLEDVRIMVSELVANGVRHGSAAQGSEIAVTVELGDRELTVDVRDPGPRFLPRAMPAPRDGSGWGLFLVDRLATSWGISNDVGSTHVWFRVDARVA